MRECCVLNPEGEPSSWFSFQRPWGWVDTGKVVRPGKFCSTVSIWGRGMIGRDYIEISKEAGSMVLDYVEEKPNK